MYLIAQLILLLFTIVYYVVSPIASKDIGQISIALVVAYISLALHFLNYRKDLLGKYYLKHSNLAILGVYVVHFQLYTDYVFDNIDRNDSFIWVYESVIVKGAFFSTIGLICFFIGYKLFGNSVKSREIKIVKNEATTKIMLFLAVISLLLYFATVNPLYLAGFYGVEEKGNIATYASLFFEMLIFGIVIQNTRNMVTSQNIPVSVLDYIKKQGYILVALLVVYFISVLFSGDRGPIITLGLCYVGSYYYVTKRTISLKVVLVSIFALATVITLLGEARNFEKKLSLSEKISKAFDEEKEGKEKVSFLPQTQELANSVRALNITLGYVPERHDYLYGHYQIQEILGCIPFVSIVTPLFFGDQHIKYITSANFVTWINQGDYPYMGDGTTCMADFYFDFGLVGIIVGMFLFGYFMRYCDLKFYTSGKIQLFSHILIVVYLCQALYISRSSFISELKFVVWVYMLLWINKRFLSKI
ncbi:MAG: O-antigen polymerase [Limnohabitans sp.]|nr:O-antigen polymerase [Limnohabitans sp.]